MNPLIRFVLIGSFAVAGSSVLGQTNFSVSDDFSVSGTGNWGHQSFTGTGGFNVTGGVLNYTDSGLLASATSTGYRDWLPNTGSYVQDWQVQVDFNFNFTQVSGQTSSWSLYAGNLNDITDSIQGRFQFSTSAGGVPSYNVIGLFNTNGAVDSSPAPVQLWDIGSNGVAFQASYLASTHTLMLGYDADGAANGYSFTGVTSAVIDASGLNWGMTNSDGFGFRLAAENSAGSNATSALGLGQSYADNFAASSIPEPSTYAAILGACALMAAGWRRRQR